VFDGARHVLDRRLGNRVLVVQCPSCGSTHYRLPLKDWHDLEQDIARENGATGPTELST